jgi:Protein of unknown function (DUF4238)
MAGERQHFLPRFLLKGFASRQSRQQFYTWVFQKGKEAFETNILNVGLAKNFYTHGVEVDAEQISRPKKTHCLTTWNISGIALATPE